MVIKTKPKFILPLLFTCFLLSCHTFFIRITYAFLHKAALFPMKKEAAFLLFGTSRNDGGGVCTSVTTPPQLFLTWEKKK